MMRPIRFRQWNPRTKIFQYDIGASKEGCWVGPASVTWSECPLTQFTGLFDRHAKEIWEGDIVKFRIPLPVEKRENANFPTGSIKYCGASFFIDCQTFAFALTNNVEVIGNIYENPELLKEDK